MKKTLLLFILLSALASARASDTLTVRQVFNFSVGDTFDYQYYHWVSFPPTTGFSATDYLANYGCSRQIVQNKFYSLDSSIVIYVIQNTNNYVDTLKYGFLDSFIIAYDTILPPSDTIHSYNINYATDSTFSSYFNSSFYQFYHGYQKGLGALYSEQTSHQYNSLGTGGTDDITRLVYYSKGTLRWGTPCSVLAGINDVIANKKVNLYPNPSSDQLHLSISDASQHYQFILSDLLGKELLSQPITEKETTLNISNLAAGLYTWRLISDNVIIKTGKVVKE
jgi:hypothetical protein